MSDEKTINPPLRLLAAFQSEADKEPEQLLQLEGREMWVAADLTGGICYRVIVPDLNARISFDRSSAKRKKTNRNRPLPSWSYYVAGALGVLDRRGLAMDGATIVIVGSEPKGPRYHYALGMAFAGLWLQVNNQSFVTQDLIDIMETVQQDYIR